MPTQKYLAPISELIDVSKIPADFEALESFAQEGVDFLLGKIYYKDFVAENSVNSDTAYYYLVIATKSLRLAVPGTGMNIVFFKGSEASVSEFPLTFAVTWPIKKYVSNFNIAGFSYLPQALLDIFLELTNTDQRIFLRQIVLDFLNEGDDAYLDFFNNLKSTISVYSDGSPAVDAELLNISNQLDIIRDEAEDGLTTGNLFTAETIFDDYEDYPVFVNAISSINASLDVLGDDLDIEINLFKEVILTAVSGISNIDELFDRFVSLFDEWLSDITIKQIKDLLVPQFAMELDGISMALEFPRSILKPLIETSPDVWEVDETMVGTPPELIKTSLNFTSGPLRYDTQTGFDIAIDENLTIDLPRCRIGNTDFDLEFLQVKLDLSRKKNIPEAIADGRPEDFIGAYITEGAIYFPTFWNHDDGASTGELKVKNFLVGTGGISGTISLEAKTLGDPSPLISAKFGGGFIVSLNAFDLTFQQNAIISSNIHGSMEIPGFKDTLGNQAVINIDIHIGTEGDFSVTASEDTGITALSIPGILDVEIKSLTVGREDDRFFVAVSGALDFKDQSPSGEDNSSFIGKFLPDKLEIQKLIIWEDGEVELEGGTIVLSKAISLKIGPVELSITAIGFGSHEQMHNGVLRKYKFFEFSGGISLDPGGVDARGDGIKFYFTVDNDIPGFDLHIFVRIAGIGIDIIIPGNAKPEEAALLLSGYLSMKEPNPANPDPNAGTEYAGGVDFALPKLKMGGSAAMRINPKVPAFIVDIGLELATPIVLGSTGLGIYGFRALVGLRYVASRTAAGLQADAEWWQYYKAKVADQYAEGIQVGKFDQTPGFSLGAGVSLATVPDSGKAFSSKIFFLLSLPEVFLLQGQAQILKERIGLDTTTDPPFFALIAISNSSVETAFGVDYKVPDDKRPGSIAKVFGILEMGFFFGNASAWYINVGRDLPEDRRIQVELLELFNAYFYMMLSGNGIRAGAGASFEVNKKFGPLRAELGAYLDIAGKIQFKPKQMGGSIQLGGHVGLYIFKFGFSISVHASLAAEAPKPFIVTGSLEACIKVLRKDRCAKFNFTWTKDSALDFDPIAIIDTPIASKALNMLTQETFDLRASTGLLGAGDISSLDNYVVPMDSFIDIEFLKGVLPEATISNLIGGNTMGAKYIDFSAPQKGKSPRVRHEYHLNSLSIKTWDSATNSWVPYDIYAAATPLADAPFVTADLSILKSGFWQYQSPKLHNKLRIMAQSPLNFLSQGSGDTIPEELGVGVTEVLCAEEEIPKCCFDFNDVKLNDKIPEVLVPGNELTYFEKFLFRITDNDAHIVIQPYQDFKNALAISDGDQMEFFFNEPMACFSIVMQSHVDGLTISYYASETLPDLDESGQPQYDYVLVLTKTLTPADLNVPILYEDSANPIDKVVIEAGVCEPGIPIACDADITKQAKELGKFLSVLAKNRHLSISNNLYPSGSSIYNWIFQFTSLYNKPVGKATTIDTKVTNLSETSLDFDILDNSGFLCQVHLELKDPAQGPIDFGQIETLSNLTEDADNVVVGENFDFFIDATFSAASGLPAMTLRGRSCYNIINCYDDCSTYIYKFCFLGIEDVLYNETLATGPEVQAEIDSMVEGFEKSIQPIWRPNTYIAIELNTTDKMFEEGSSSLSASQTQTHVFSFKTEGPIGYFHNFRPEYQTLLSVDREDEFKLSGLKHYIDYEKSFPNADGSLINAKPIFYIDPKLLLFYKREYVYEMFRGWDELLNPTSYPETQAELEVLIKDPAPDTTILEPGAVQSVWVKNLFPLIPGEVNVLNNMVENGNPCVNIDAIEPFGVNTEFPLYQLKPLKLYAAIFNAKFKLITDTNFDVSEVHRYVFQTSRYGTFAEQINSYQLLLDEDTSAILKEAIFDVNTTVAPSDISVAQSILDGTMVANDPLRQEFMMPYDRLIDGVLKLGALHPPVTTEFNLIKDDSTGNILGILIRNPEPFNDPKLPDIELAPTITLSVATGLPGVHKVLYSKDKRNAFVTNSDNSMNVATGDHQYIFEFKLYDGNAYSVVESITVDLIIS